MYHPVEARDLHAHAVLAARRAALLAARGAPQGGGIGGKGTPGQGVEHGLHIAAGRRILKGRAYQVGEHVGRQQQHIGQRGITGTAALFQVGEDILQPVGQAADLAEAQHARRALEGMGAAQQARGRLGGVGAGLQGEKAPAQQRQMLVRLLGENIEILALHHGGGSLRAPRPGA